MTVTYVLRPYAWVMMRPIVVSWLVNAREGLELRNWENKA